MKPGPRKEHPHQLMKIAFWREDEKTEHMGGREWGRERERERAMQTLVGDCLLAPSSASSYGAKVIID